MPSTDPGDGGARLVLRGGLVHDGSGGPAVRADVAIDGDRIVSVGDQLDIAGAEAVDVSGLHVAPGFIDMHSHSDTALIADPVNAAKTRQGITLDVIGQDGLGVAPFDPERDVAWRQSLLALTGQPDLDWTWRSFADHLAAIEAAGPATNVAALLAFGTVRNAVLGGADRPPTRAEADRMDGLIDEAMAAGAFGMSVGLVYPPAVYATTDELVRAYSVVGRHGGLMVVHLRSQGVAWL
jgi:N-acyl-D-amino-acid deacylase